MVDATQSSILDAAELLFARQGYRKTTIEDVARTAELSKRTVYLYFRSREELTLATIDRIVDRLLDRLESIARSEESAGLRLSRMLLDRVLFRFDSVQSYSHGLDELLGQLRPAYMARRARYFAREADLIARVLSEGAADGSLESEDVAATSRLLLLATNALLPSGLSQAELGDRAQLESTTRALIQLLLDGLKTRDSGGA